MRDMMQWTAVLEKLIGKEATNGKWIHKGKVDI